MSSSNLPDLISNWAAQPSQLAALRLSESECERDPGAAPDESEYQPLDVKDHELNMGVESEADGSGRSSGDTHNGLVEMIHGEGMRMLEKDNKIIAGVKIKLSMQQQHAARNVSIAPTVTAAPVTDAYGATIGRCKLASALVCSGTAGAVSVVDAANRKVRSHMRVQEGAVRMVSAVMCSSNSDRAYVAAGIISSTAASNTLMKSDEPNATVWRVDVWDPDAPAAPLRSVQPLRDLTSLVLVDAEEGVLLVTGTASGRIQVLNLDSSENWTLRRQQQLESGNATLHCVAAVDGRVSAVTAAAGRLLVVAGYSSGAAEVYDGRSSTLLHVLEQHERAVLAVDVCWAPHRRSAWVCSGSADGTAVLWDGGSGALLRRFYRQRVAVVAVGMVADSVGRGAERQTICWVCSGCADGTAVLWDGASGAALRRFTSEQASLSSLALTISTAVPVAASAPAVPRRSSQLAASGGVGAEAGQSGVDTDADADAETADAGAAIGDGAGGVQCDRLWLAIACSEGEQQTHELTDLLQVSRWMRGLQQSASPFPCIQSAADILRRGSKKHSKERSSKSGGSYVDARHRDRSPKDVVFPEQPLQQQQDILSINAQQQTKQQSDQQQQQHVDYLADALLRLLPELLDKPLTSAVHRLIKAPSIVTPELSQVLRDDLQCRSARVLDVFRVLSDSSKVRRVGEEVASLQGFLPALLKLPTAVLDEAVNTRLMVVIINSLMTTRHMMNVLLVDGVVVSLMIALFIYTAWFGQTESALTSDLLICAALILLFAVYILIKDIAVPALEMYKLRLFTVWLLSPAVFISALASITLLALFGALLRGGEFRTSDRFRIIGALVAGPVFSKALMYIRLFNKSFSTFVTSLYQIVFDLRFFVVVLSIAMCCFAVIMYLLLTPRIGNDLLANPSTEAFGTVRSTFLTLYLLMLGEFDLEWFAEQSSTGIQRISVLAFVAYLFVVTILLLNILIAVVSDSYEKAMTNSGCLYMRTRLEFLVHVKALVPVPERYIAEHEAQQRELTLLDYKWVARSIARYCNCLPLPLAAMIYSTCTLLFIPVMLLVSVRRFMYLIFKQLLWPARHRIAAETTSTRTMNFDDAAEDLSGDTSGGTFDSSNTSGGGGDSGIGRVGGVLLTSRSGTADATDGGEEGWEGRQLYLSRRFQQMAAEEASNLRSYLNQRLKAISEDTSRSLQRLEERVASQHEAMEQRLSGVEASLRELITALQSR